MPRPRKRWKVRGDELRSGLEAKIATQLINDKVDYTYETESFMWLERLPRAQCTHCGSKKSCFVERSYTPDFFLPNGVILEVKGKFTSRDRKIAAAMKEQYPDLDIRMVFEKDNWLNKNHKNRYSDWCKSKGIDYCLMKVPESWLK